MIFGGAALGSQATSHRPRPMQDSAFRGAQRSVESFLSLSQQDGHRGRQGSSAVNEECKRGREAIRRDRVLPPPAPNDLRGGQTAREEFLDWLRLGSFDDGGAKGSFASGSSGTAATVDARPRSQRAQRRVAPSDGGYASRADASPAPGAVPQIAAPRRAQTCTAQ